MSSILNKILREKKQIYILFLLTSLVVSGGCLFAQNINNPNNNGPLGTKVNTLSGNLFMPRTDIFIPARGINIELTFNYNSFDYDQNNGFGNGWSFNYGIKYKTDTSGKVTIVQGDDREDIYTPSPGGGFTPPAGIFDNLSQNGSGKYLLKTKFGMQYYFDNSTHKHVTKITEPNGNYLNFNYSDTLLSSITNTAGQTITLNYTAGLLTSVIDAIASPTRTYNYAYDGYGNLTQVTDPLGNKMKYQYLVNGPMSQLTDKNGNVADIIYFSDLTVRELITCNSRKSFSYDTTTNLTTVVDYMTTGSNQVTTYAYKTFSDQAWLSQINGNCCGFNLIFDFDKDGNVVKKTDANGNSYFYTYDNKGNVVSITDPLNRKKTYAYSSDYNQVTKYIDANNNTYSVSYDANGNPITFTEPGNKISTATYSASGDMVTWTDANGNTYQYNYDAYGNAIRITSPLNTIINKEYDARGNIISSTDMRGNKFTAQNDLLDRLTSVRDPLNNILSMAYDPAGNVSSYTDQNGNKTTYNYDASNRLVSIIDAEGHSQEYTYDEQNNIIKFKNKLGNSTNYYYDNLNRISSIVDALGNVYSYNYDNNGNIISVIFPNGQTITNTYNKVDKLTSSNDAIGSLGSFVYDNNNNIISYTNGTSSTVSGSYNASNQLIGLTDPLGNSMTFTYDKNNNLLSSTDRNNNKESFEYDALNRIKISTDKNGSVTIRNYDENGNIIAVFDPNNNKSEFGFDVLNRLVSQKFANGSFVHYTYDNLGNILNQQLPNGNTISFQYDKINRLKSKTLPGNNVFNYSYDSKGRLVTATNNVSTVNLSYDALDRLISESLNGHVTSYNYNISTRSQNILYPDNSRIFYNYDFRNRLSGITKDNVIIASYQYNNANQLQQINYSNGVNANYTYDFSSRLSAISTSSSIVNRSFTYDKELNKTLIAKANTPGESEQFTYDANHRLNGYKLGILSGNNIPTPTLQHTYAYDALGNRTSFNLNGLNTTYNTNSLNQYLNANNSNQNLSFTYDANGNLTFDGTFYKIYDAEGRLITDSSSGNKLVFQYDALGRRIQKINNSGVTNYFYSGIGQIEQRDAISDTLINETVNSGSFTPLLEVKNHQNFFYHQNELNSVEAITDAGGNLVERYQYDPYGKTSILDAANNPLAVSKIANRFGFTGQEYDRETGSYHFLFRNYSPSTGSFNQRDPLGYGDGMGLYQYVHDNPANSVDILGLKDCPGTILITNAEWDQEVNKMADEMRRRTSGYGVFSDEATHISFYELAKNIFDSKYHNDLEFTDANAETQKYSFRGKEYTRSEINYYFEGMLFKSGGYDYSDLQMFVSGWKKIRYNLSPTPGVSDMYTLGYNETPDPGWGIYLNSLNPLAMMTSAPSLGGNFGVYNSKSHSAYTDPENLPTVPNEDTYYKYRLAIDANGKPFIKSFLKDRAKGDRRPVPPPKVPCPPNDNNGGSKKRKPPKPLTIKDIIKFFLEILNSHDPNEIIGPDGVGNQKWVSINDNIPYTILYENSLSASAPAKTVRIVYPVDPKQNEKSISLGSFGFNNLTFNVPPNTASYYQRLNTADSLGVYVDVTAGLDVVKHELFWQFQSIDPATQLPPTDPLKGFLQVRDTTNSTAGHGFVNFSIKPVSTAHTGDTMHAAASIIFDLNDVIPTNVAKNTIDALPPTTHLNSTAQTVGPATVRLNWNGKDDRGGSGLAGYSLYVSQNGRPYELYRSQITDTSLIFTGIPDSTYCFFIAGKDSVNNSEPLSNQCDLSVTLGHSGYVSLPTDYFRSVVSGAWNVPATWQSSRDNTIYYPATLSPDSSANTITIQDGHTITVTSNVITDQTVVNPLGALIVSGSVLTVTNNGLRLRSDLSGTARIGNSTGTISGNVIVERYIPANAKRAWRLLSIPDSTVQTINAAWQNGQPAGVTGPTGTGTMITSNNGNASFDFQTPGNSMLIYNASTDTWTGIANTTSPIKTDNGYFLFVRGDRTATPTNGVISSTTLSTTGKLKQGNYPAVPITVQGSRFGILGNPYASQIDFRILTKGVGIDNTFYVWDPKLSGPFGVGGYQTLTYNGSNYIIIPGGGSYGSGGSVMNSIESGQGFIVHASSTDNISFSENAKTSGSNMVFRTTSIPNESLVTNIYSVATSGDALEDGTMSLFGNYSNTVDGMDALKLTNFGLNLGMIRDGKTLAVEKRQILTTRDTIFFSLANVKQQPYRFEFIANGLDHPGLSAWLIDKYLNTSTAVDLNGTTSVSFLVNSDSASANSNRFIIVFAKPLSVPVNTASSILVYPNPVQSGMINLKLINLPKGNYRVRIVNSLGQTILQKQINHADGTSTENIQTNGIKGVYMLEVTKPDNSKVTIKVIVN